MALASRSMEGCNVARSITTSFQKVDKSNLGLVSREQLKKLLAQFERFDDATWKDVDAIFDAFDSQGVGAIGFEDFIFWVMDASTSSFTPPSAKPPTKKTPPRLPNKAIGLPEGEQAKSCVMPEVEPKTAAVPDSRQQKTVSEGGTMSPRRRSSIDLNYRSFLPERFDIDIEQRFTMDKLQLGEGGYGKVFVARDREFEDRKVAVKKVSTLRNLKVCGGFWQEVAAMKDLDHPNICKLLATFSQGNHMYFVMELCEGGEVFDRILEKGSISENVSADVIAQVSAALAYAHKRGIAHRDVKPENVVFWSSDPSDNHVKVIDWGLSMSFIGTPMHSAVGSFMYAAPEVLTSRSITAYTQACDLWSLGILTYVMLCGLPPFYGNPTNHLNMALNERYDLDGSPWDKISDHAKDFVRRLIKADPSKRLPSDQVLIHPWLHQRVERNDPASEDDMTRVIQNMKQFSQRSAFTRMCITAVARQLGHVHLRKIHEVFKTLDTNGDGVLSYEEIAVGFRRIYGEDEHGLESFFERLDMDGSHGIDYTEFCAAALGAKVSDQDEAMWGAFKTFDVSNKGFLSKSDLQQVLRNADLQSVWSPEVCEKVGETFVEEFDTNNDGQINFDEWREMMIKCWGDRERAEDGHSLAIASRRDSAFYRTLLDVGLAANTDTFGREVNNDNSLDMVEMVAQDISTAFSHGIVPLLADRLN